MRILAILLISTLALTAGEWTEADVRAWAIQVQDGLKDGDASIFESRYDHRRLCEMAVDPLKLKADTRRDLLKGMTDAPAAQHLPGQVLAAIADGGSYRPLRIRRDGKGWRVLFRMVTSGYACNYHELFLESKAGAEPRIVDALIFATGERLSVTMRTLVAQLLAADDPGILARVVGSGGSESKDMLAALSRLQAAQAKRDSAAILAAIDGMPKAMRETKAYQFLRVQSTMNLDESTYTAAMEEYAKRFPGDPSLLLINIDRFLLAKRFHDCLASIDQLEKQIGAPDAWMFALRSTVNGEAGDAPAAMAAARKAVEIDPEWSSTWWTLVSTALKQKDFATVSASLITLEQRFSLTMGDLTKVPDYAGFVTSPEYQAWLARNTTSAPAPAEPATP